MSGYLFFVAPAEKQWKVIVNKAEQLFASYELAYSAALHDALTMRNMGADAAVLRAVNTDEFEVAWPAPMGA